MQEFGEKILNLLRISASLFKQAWQVLLSVEWENGADFAPEYIVAMSNEKTYLPGEDILTCPEEISYLAGEDILLGRRSYLLEPFSHG